MFYWYWFLFAWLVWIIFADKRRWRELLPVCIFASFLGIGTDEMMHHYPLWEYIGSPYLIHLADDIAIYPVVIYLFIQWLPRKRTARSLLAYWFVWTGLAVTIELIYVYSGHMRYHQWWTTWHSYAADWFLYWLFYRYHRLLKLERLLGK
jgi:hypothetical protein